MEFDYVVVGAGAAGAVIARRLTDNGDSVLLLEAGSSDRHPYIQIPAGFIYLLRDSLVSWGYSTQAESGIGGRTLVYPRGKVLGGSGSINGMMQSWGLPYDFDRWASEGCPGWSFNEVRPYFMKSESYAHGNPETRGRSGPIAIADFATPHPIAKDLLRAGQQLGLQTLQDYNSDFREGLGLVQQTRRGRFRETASTAYLRPLRNASNLRIETSAKAVSIDLKGAKAVGVTYRQGSAMRTVRARREIILSAGSINSPHLLNLSGIGDATQLQSLGIAVKHHLPDVGLNLQDHYVTKTVRRIEGKRTLNEQGRGLNLLAEIANYVLRGKGILTYSFACATGYLKSSPGLKTPDLQISFAPGSFTPGKGYALDPDPGMTLGIWQMRPESRGRVQTRSADPSVAPAITLGYLQSEADQRAAVSAVRWSRRLLFADVFAAYGRDEVFPGPGVNTDDELLEYARRTGGTTFHPVGSCRMGSDERSVVDPQLRVRGVAGLRVADASVMPHITSSNTHAPTVMIAEKAADMIIGSARES